MRILTRATSAQEYIQQINEPRRNDIIELDAFIRQIVPQLKPIFIYGMLGYGPYHYKYASGREGDTAIVALANQKNYISLYINAFDDTGYIVEKYKTQLPKARIGKSCIRFKRLSDVDKDVIATILLRGAKLMTDI